MPASTFFTESIEVFRVVNDACVSALWRAVKPTLGLKNSKNRLDNKKGALPIRLLGEARSQAFQVRFICC